MPLIAMGHPCGEGLCNEKKKDCCSDEKPNRVENWEIPGQVLPSSDGATITVNLCPELPNMVKILPVEISTINPTNKGLLGCLMVTLEIDVLGNADVTFQLTFDNSLRLECLNPLFVEVNTTVQANGTFFPVSGSASGTPPYNAGNPVMLTVGPINVPAAMVGATFSFFGFTTLSIQYSCPCCVPVPDLECLCPIEAPTVASNPVSVAVAVNAPVIRTSGGVGATVITPSVSSAARLGITGKSLVTGQLTSRVTAPIQAKLASSVVATTQAPSQLASSVVATTQAPSQLASSVVATTQAPAAQLASNVGATVQAASSVVATTQAPSQLSSNVGATVQAASNVGAAVQAPAVATYDDQLAAAGTGLDWEEAVSITADHSDHEDENTITISPENLELLDQLQNVPELAKKKPDKQTLKVVRWLRELRRGDAKSDSAAGTESGPP